MGRKITTKRVRSWKESPFPEYPASVKAFAHLPARTIYARKDTSKSDIEHERFHMAKRHPDRPRNPAVFAGQEIDATLYAYKKLGRPTHILGQLRGIFNDLNWREYKVSRTRALSIIKRKLFRTPNIPISWKSDYFKLQKERS